jgi:hypothetical protein
MFGEFFKKMNSAKYLKSEYKDYHKIIYGKITGKKYKEVYTFILELLTLLEDIKKNKDNAFTDKFLNPKREESKNKVAKFKLTFNAIGGIYTILGKIGLNTFVENIYNFVKVGSTSKTYEEI